MLENEQFQKVLNYFPKDIKIELKDYLKKHARITNFKKGTMLLESPFSQKIYIILSGSCIRYIINDEGEERAIMFHTEGFMRILGDIYIKREHSAVEYFVKMNEDSEMIEIDIYTFAPVALSCPVYVNFGTQIALQNLSTQNQLQSHFIGLSKEAFLKWLFAHYGFIFQRFRGKDIAHFMGVSPTWLSLLKAKILKNNKQ